MSAGGDKRLENKVGQGELSVEAQQQPIMYSRGMLTWGVMYSWQHPDSETQPTPLLHPSILLEILYVNSLLA